MKTIFQQYWLPILGGAIGLLVSILFLTLGFSKTLLVIILSAIGAAVGFYVDRLGIFRHYFPPK